MVGSSMGCRENESDMGTLAAAHCTCSFVESWLHSASYCSSYVVVHLLSLLYVFLRCDLTA